MGIINFKSTTVCYCCAFKVGLYSLFLFSYNTSVGGEQHYIVNKV